MSAALAVCVNCGLAAYPLARGYCAECLEIEAPDLPASDRASLELRAVAACRAAGLRAIPRLCDDPRCSCANERARTLRTTVAGRVRYAGRQRYESTFGERDANDLERYYSREYEPRWEQSVFGRMCDRIAEQLQVDPDEKLRFERIGSSKIESQLAGILQTKLTTIRVMVCASSYDMVVNGKRVEVMVMRAGRPPEAQPSEVVHLGPPSHNEPVAYDEDDLSSHFDMRSGMRRVHAVLDKLPRWARTTLEARYSPSEEQGGSHKILGRLAPVALLTETAKKLRAKLADHGVVEGMRDMVATMTRISVDSTVSSDDRRGAVDGLESMRRESEALLAEAQRIYASTAMAGDQ